MPARLDNRTQHYCGKCKKFIQPDRKGKVPRHQVLDPKTFEKTGEWCDGAGSEPKVHVNPEAPPQVCQVCKKPIPFGEPCYAVKECMHIVDFGRGRATYVMEPGGRVVGGIHKTCLVVVD